jgi:hypothetical protein
MVENKSNKRYFERALSKSLTNFGHTTLKEQPNYSHVFESLLLTTKMFCQLASPAKVLFLISGPIPALFSELHRLLRGTIENFIVAVVSLFIGRRMSIQKMLRKRIPLHPSWNYIIFT